MSNQPPFRFELKKRSSTLIEVAYIGYMAEQDNEHIVQSQQQLSLVSTSVSIMYDLSQMTGFHRSQVVRHGEMFLPHRTKIAKIGLVSARPMVRFGALSVALLARLTVKFFEDKEEALVWLTMTQ